jgi:hypothetical protein
MARKILNQPGLRIGSSPTPRPHQQQNGKDDPKHFLACPLNTTQAGPLGSLHEWLLPTRFQARAGRRLLLHAAAKTSPARLSTATRSEPEIEA